MLWVENLFYYNNSQPGTGQSDHHSQKIQEVLLIKVAPLRSSAIKCTNLSIPFFSNKSKGRKRIEITLIIYYQNQTNRPPKRVY